MTAGRRGAEEPSAPRPGPPPCLPGRATGKVSYANQEGDHMKSSKQDKAEGALKTAVEMGILQGPRIMAGSRDLSTTGHSLDHSFAWHWEDKASWQRSQTRWWWQVWAVARRPRQVQQARGRGSAAAR